MVVQVVAGAARAGGRAIARSAAGTTRGAKNTVRNTTSSSHAPDVTTPATDNSYQYQSAAAPASQPSAIGKQRQVRKQQAQDDDATEEKTPRPSRLPLAQINNAERRKLARALAKFGAKKTGKKALRTSRAITFLSLFMLVYKPIFIVQAFLGIAASFAFYFVFISDGVTGTLINLFPTEDLLALTWGPGIVIAVVTHIPALCMTWLARINVSHPFALMIWAVSFICALIPFTMWLPVLYVWALLVILTQ